MLQDVTRPSETQGLSKVGHCQPCATLCHQSWKKVLGIQGPRDGAVQHFSTLSLTPRRNNFLQARKHAPRFEQLSLDLQSSEFLTGILTMYAMYSMQSHEQRGESLQWDPFSVKVQFLWEWFLVASLSRSNPSFGHANLLNQHRDAGP